MFFTLRKFFREELIYFDNFCFIIFRTFAFIIHNEKAYEKIKSANIYVNFNLFLMYQIELI